MPFFWSIVALFLLIVWYVLYVLSYTLSFADRLDGAAVYVSTTSDYSHSTNSQVCGTLRPAQLATGESAETVRCNSAVGRYITIAAAPVATEAWPVMMSKGSFGNVDRGADAFNAMFTSSRTHIARRQCPSCQDGYKELYYKRLTDLDTFGPYDLL
eukprot:SAG31_NODE_1241_length_9165_cov_4.706155_1_plen_155_part_10